MLRSQDVPQLQLAAAAAEGGAGLQQLARRAQAGAPGRREPADGGRAAPGTPAALRVGRAPGRGTGGGRSCAIVNEDACFNQRPRFEQVVGYLERNEPLPLDQPDRKATSFITSHFYLDDFVQSSEDPNPRPLQHTPLQAIPERPRTRTCALCGGTKGTAEPALLRMTWQETPRPAPWPATGRGRPPSRTGAAGLAAAQAFRSQLPQDAAEYVRLNVLPRPGQAQPPPQIIGRPSDVERLLDEAGQRAQEVERDSAGR